MTVCEFRAESSVSKSFIRGHDVRYAFAGTRQVMDLGWSARIVEIAVSTAQLAWTFPDEAFGSWAERWELGLRHELRPSRGISRFPVGHRTELNSAKRCA